MTVQEFLESRVEEIKKELRFEDNWIIYDHYNSHMQQVFFITCAEEPVWNEEEQKYYSVSKPHRDGIAVPENIDLDLSDGNRALVRIPRS